MEIEELEIFIRPDGEVIFEVRGIKGKRCCKITEEIEREMGSEIIERKETAEMHEEPVSEELEHKLSDRGV
ncbi:MAG: DUF2997 domain-containing protein [bacterium]